jgi:hypothetical protein
LDDDMDLDTVFEDFASRNIWKRFLQGNKTFLFEVILIVTVFSFKYYRYLLLWIKHMLQINFYYLYYIF